MKYICEICGKKMKEKAYFCEKCWSLYKRDIIDLSSFLLYQFEREEARAELFKRAELGEFDNKYKKRITHVNERYVSEEDFERF